MIVIGERINKRLVIYKNEMKRKLPAVLFVLYLAIWGSYCGLEINTFIEDQPFFQMSVLLLFINVVFILLIPPLLYGLCVQAPQWLKKYLMPAILVFNSFYVHLAILLSIYKADRHMDFDFNFFWQNISDAWPVLWKIFAIWLIVIFISLIVFTLLQPLIFDPAARWLKEFSKFSWKFGLTLGVAIAACALCQYFTITSVSGSAAGFLYTGFFSDRRLRDDYISLYAKHIEALKKDTLLTTDRFNPSVLGDSIFIVKQESLNGLLSDPEITPQLFRAGRDGILIPKMYGNAIQSLRGYSCILCGVPPSVTFALSDVYPADELSKLNCLPQIFRNFGYRALYFFGGSHNPRIVRFAESIGFEKVLADDIMSPKDIKFDWGYREDIFYLRVREYLKANYEGQKLFVFIDTGATNHSPFEVLDESLKRNVPFPTPAGFTERLSNTTFVQDAYLGNFYDIFREDYGDRGTLIAVSDHAWPIPIHKNNIFNERGAYEENFLISLLFVPPASEAETFDIGARVPVRFSQMDIQPTILDLLGIARPALLGESFAPWLLADPKRARTEPQKAKLSIQPYGGGFIAIHRYPQKYLFDILKKDVKVYDLSNDPLETSPTIDATDRYIFLIRDFFR